MSRMSFRVLGLAAALAVLSAAGAAYAQAPAATATPAASDAATAAPAKAKPKPAKKVEKKAAKKKLPTVAVAVSNGRASGVTSLVVSPASGGDGKEIVKGLAPGKKKTVNVEHDKDCLFDIHADFDDGATSDAPSINLCKDKAINLKD